MKLLIVLAILFVGSSSHASAGNFEDNFVTTCVLSSYKYAKNELSKVEPGFNDRAISHCNDALKNLTADEKKTFASTPDLAGCSKAILHLVTDPKIEGAAIVGYCGIYSPNSKFRSDSLEFHRSANIR